MRHTLLLALVLAACSPTTLQVREVEPGLWRSNQPVTNADWTAVKALGVTTIVKLNMPDEGSDDGARALGMQVYDLGIPPRGDLASITTLPDEDRLRAAETVIELGGGVLVHCTHGQDRTGLVIGRHRVISDGWTKARAYREMLELGFHPALVGLSVSWATFNAP